MMHTIIEILAIWFALSFILGAFIGSLIHAMNP